MKTKPIPERPAPEPPPVPRLALSVPETAQASGLSRAKLYELMKAGELKFRKCGSRRIILVADLQDCLARLPQGPEAA